MSIGLKGTLKTIIKFPPIILTPIFSIWTIGPVMSKKSVCGNSCYNGHQKLGVSICFTWINLLLTLASGFAYYSHIGYSFRILLVLSCPCLAIADISNSITMFGQMSRLLLPLYCESNCYPVTQFTYLDVNNMDIIITQEEIELDQLCNFMLCNRM